MSLSEKDHEETSSLLNHGEVCLLIDFENVALGFRVAYPDHAVDLTSLMTLASETSESKRVVIARAYADWRFFSNFTEHLVSLGIQAVQAPSYRLQGRNGTDIQMAVEAIDLLHLRPDLGTFIIATGDSDFNALVMILHERGKKVIGVGVEGSISPYFENVCDRFVRLGVLMGLRKSVEPAEPEKPEAAPPKRIPFRQRLFGTGAPQAPATTSPTGNGLSAKAPGDPLTEALESLQIETNLLLPARRLKELLPLVAEIIEQGYITDFHALNQALPKRFPDQVTRQDSKKISLLLDRLKVLPVSEETNWMLQMANDPESLLDSLLATFELRLKEATGITSPNPMIIGRLFFGDGIGISEMKVRLSRGRHHLEEANR